MSYMLPREENAAPLCSMSCYFNGIKIDNKKSQFYLYINNYTSGFIPQTVPMRLHFFVNYYILKYEKLGHIAMPISNPSVREILYTQEVSSATSKCRNAGMLQKRLVGYRYFTGIQLCNPASAFRLQDQSDTVGHGLVRHWKLVATRLVAEGFEYRLCWKYIAQYFERKLAVGEGGGKAFSNF
jgi:hypothetical protein